MLSWAVVLGLLARQILAIPTISAKGSKLFTSDGAQFYIKGLAYQPTPDDPLANTNQCQLDVALMQTLGTNAIRVYHVDASLNHDGCMTAFANAGIYAWIDLDTFSTYILQNTSPTPQWTQSMFQAYADVMDTFQKYDNVAGFFVGNEMLTTGASSIAAPYVKAAAADMKAYRDKQGYRDIPIGYSAADIPALRPNLQNYLACGSNPADAVDFYSLNAYEWCGDSSYDESGYDILEKNASNYNIPIFFSETGCIVPEPRLFTDQAAILGPEMDQTWSGAIIYEWVETTNNYGLISYGPPSGAQPTVSVQPEIAGYSVGGAPTPINPGFTNLKNEWATLSPTGVSSNAYTPSNSPPACPSYTSGYWEVSGNVALPTIGAAAVTGPTGSAASAGSGSSAQSSGSAKSSASHNGAARPTHIVHSAGMAAIEGWFGRTENSNPALFWFVGIACAILGPAIAL